MDNQIKKRSKKKKKGQSRGKHQNILRNEIEGRRVSRGLDRLFS
jgi:hypothetical protein